MIDRTLYKNLVTLQFLGKPFRFFAYNKYINNRFNNETFLLIKKLD